MAGNIKKYKIGRNRLVHSLMDGFALSENGTLQTTDDKQIRHIFMRGLDGAEDDLSWGRLSFKTVSHGDLVLTVRATASNDPVFIRKGELTKINDFLLNPEISPSIKEQFFGIADGVESSGAQDILLYKLKGRYLYLWFEINGVCSASISNITIFVPGDNFARTFPAVYQTEDDFFKRYLSVFSTMYNEFQETIDDLDSFLDPDTASIPALRHFATWLGIETEGSLTDEASLRRVVKAAPELLSVKGTKQAVESVIKLFVTDPFYVIERNLLTAQQLDCEMYGSTPYDFTILINRKADEPLRACLEFFINQFKPVRSRHRIIFFGSNSGLDSFTFLDFNGTVLQSAPGQLDDGNALTGMTYLK